MGRPGLNSQLTMGNFLDPCVSDTSFPKCPEPTQDVRKTEMRIDTWLIIFIQEMLVSLPPLPGELALHTKHVLKPKL